MQFHIGLSQEISVRNHMCQCSACFMEARCMFIGFVVAYGGFIWFYWLQIILKFNVLDLCFPRPTSGKWQKLFFLYFHHYCRYLNQIWSAHRYNKVILAGQVSRQILQGTSLDSHRHIIDSSELWWSMVAKVHIFKQICLILMHF